MRRGGVRALRPADLDPDQCLILLREKGETVRWQPVSPTLMARLVRHGQERHAPPGGRLLRYADGRPITSRRYDHLWAWIGRQLPWVRTQQISTHWIRNFGYAVARAYAGHTDASGDAGATSTYVRASLSTRALPRARIERLLSSRDIPLREKTLWRMLYETAARASEILALNVEDLDFEQRRAPVRSKGGDTEFVYWDTGTAHLLPRLLRLPGGATRTSGPLFLASRRPVPARRAAPRDICPHTGRARLGYDRARVLFKKYTATGGGLELHQLRHSAATHLGDQKVPLQLIMAKTRHKSPRTAMRYVKLSDAAVAEVTSLLGPPRRSH